jgi:hypothetical protein
MRAIYTAKFILFDLITQTILSEESNYEAPRYVII